MSVLEQGSDGYALVNINEAPLLFRVVERTTEYLICGHNVDTKVEIQEPVGSVEELKKFCEKKGTKESVNIWAYGDGLNGFTGMKWTNKNGWSKNEV